MYELINAQGGVGTSVSARMGLYQLDKSQVCLIDSGTGGRRQESRENFERKRLVLACIVNTHSHADHIGATNAYSRAPAAGCSRQGAEAAVTRQPSRAHPAAGISPGELRTNS